MKPDLLDWAFFVLIVTLCATMIALTGVLIVMAGSIS